MKIGEIWKAKDGSKTIQLTEPKMMKSELKMEASECIEESFAKPPVYVGKEAEYWGYIVLESKWDYIKIGGTGMMLSECFKDYVEIAEREK